MLGRMLGSMVDEAPQAGVNILVDVMFGAFCVRFRLLLISWNAKEFENCQMLLLNRPRQPFSTACQSEASVALIHDASHTMQFLEHACDAGGLRAVPL